MTTMKRDECAAYLRAWLQHPETAEIETTETLAAVLAAADMLEADEAAVAEERARIRDAVWALYESDEDYIDRAKVMAAIEPPKPKEGEHEPRD